MYIRWLGAHRVAYSLRESLIFEMENARSPKGREIAVERVRGEQRPGNAGVGLLISSKAIRRQFLGDVWSETVRGGRLVPSYPADRGPYSEAFASPGKDDILGLVLSRRISPGNMKVVRWFAKQNHLPIFLLSGRRLKRMK